MPSTVRPSNAEVLFAAIDASSSAYLDRSDVRSGMLVRPAAVLGTYAHLGWGWGGDWTSSKDYQYLSATGG